MKILKAIRIFAVIILVLAGFSLWRLNSDPESFFETTVGTIAKMIDGDEGKVTTITQTSLEDVLEISELSTVDFTYNAIAKVYENDDSTAKYYIAYDGTVNAGIDFEKIQMDIDDENKIITLTLPDSEIQNTIVDFGSMEYIFVDNSSETETISQEAYEICRNDLAERAKKEKQLLEMAKENAKSVVEALVKPWVIQIDPEYVVTIE